MRAIKDVGGELSAAMDPNDSVGIIDSYFPSAAFFTEFERFDRHVDKLRREGQKLDYISICSPNYLHDAHMRFALRNHAHAICEKPLVLSPWNLDSLEEMEREFGKRVCTILQLRLHPAIIELRDRIAAGGGGKKHDVDLTYLTSRGDWYSRSWKGAGEKSGGIASNIGIHFFDMLGWIFGGAEKSIVHLHDGNAAGGFLELENARVRWFLSIDANHLPNEVREKGQRTFRSIKVDGHEIEFSEGFTDLHTISYAEILNGNIFGVADARPAVQLAYDIRNTPPIGATGEYHPFVRRALDAQGGARTRRGTG
jgi:UDP-N-acetyl-2-amino-2-deoxyglucuronate dehydrogenase